MVAEEVVVVVASRPLASAGTAASRPRPWPPGAPAWRSLPPSCPPARPPPEFALAAMLAPGTRYDGGASPCTAVPPAPPPGAPAPARPSSGLEPPAPMGPTAPPLPPPPRPPPRAPAGDLALRQAKHARRRAKFGLNPHPLQAQSPICGRRAPPTSAARLPNCTDPPAWRSDGRFPPPPPRPPAG